jgi:CHAT domain-containing protein
MVLLLPQWGRGQQEDLDALYCRLQGRLEIGAGLSEERNTQAARDTLLHALEDFPPSKNLAFERLLGEFRFYIGYSAFYNSYAAFSEYDNAIGMQSLHIADSIIGRIEGNGSDLRARILRMQGMFAYFMEENIIDAQDHYEAAYKEWLKVPQKDSLELAIVLQCMAQAATRLGEFEKGIDLYGQSLEIRKKTFGEVHVRVGFLYWNMGNAYCYSGRFEEAAQSYQKALEIYTAVSTPDQSTIASIMFNLATTFGELGNFDAAISNHKAAIEIKRKLVDTYSPELVDYLVNLALAFASKGDFLSADKAVKELKKICTYNELKEGSFMALAKSCEARVLIREKKNPQNIFNAIQAAMDAISSDTNLADWRSYPKPDATSEPFLLQQIALDKAMYLKDGPGTSGNKMESLKASLEGFELVVQLNDRMRQEFDDQDDKLHLSRKKASYLYEGLHCTYELWKDTEQPQYIDRAFRLMENGKFQLLLEFFRKSRIQASSELSKTSVRRLNVLRKRCTELDYALALPGVSADSQKYYQSELLELRIQQRNLQDSMEASSRLFKTIYGQQSTIGVDSLKKIIPASAAVIAYALADSALFVITVHKAGITFRKTALPPHFSDSVGQWLQLCRRPVEDAREIQDFARLGSMLFDLLLQREIAQLASMDQLLIIPDGILGNLPFEALLTHPTPPDENNFGQLPYLLKKYRCYYAPSATLWSDQHSIPFSQQPVECLGIAWGPDPVDSLPDIRGKMKGLAGTQEELEALEDMIQGKFLIADQATEANFKLLASQYGILHLALHARASEADPQILFPSGGNGKEDGILHFHELFPLDLRSRLAVLSACETGTGKLIQGEGIQSISSGFAAAGIPSLIMSLWEVDDKAGSAIIRSFYQGIKAGKALDESLQQAKLHYLENARGYEAAPYYWSAFVPMGNMAPLQVKAPESHAWWTVIMGAALCLCILIGIRIYVKNRKSI